MNLDFTIVDVLVALTLVVSVVYAASRGFVNETLSIVAWAAAAFAALYLAPLLAPFLRARTSPLAGTLLAYAAVFVAVLVPLSIVSYRISESVRNSEVGMVDRVLGVIFGVVRGLAIVGIAYLVFCMFVPVRDHPRWVREAQSLPLIRSSSEVLLALVPDQHLQNAAGQEDAGNEKTLQAGPKAQGREGEARHRTHKSYGAEDRRGLDRLFQAAGDGNQP